MLGIVRPFYMSEKSSPSLACHQAQEQARLIVKSLLMLNFSSSLGWHPLSSGYPA